jgi:hypothetical protein
MTIHTGSPSSKAGDRTPDARRCTDQCPQRPAFSGLLHLLLLLRAWSPSGPGASRSPSGTRCSARTVSPRRVLPRTWPPRCDDSGHAGPPPSQPSRFRFKRRPSISISGAAHSSRRERACGERAVRGVGRATEVVEDVGHAQWVFTVPKMLRVYFLYHRELLGELSRAAAQTAKELLAAAVILRGVFEPGSGSAPKGKGAARGERLRRGQGACPTSARAGGPEATLGQSYPPRVRGGPARVSAVPSSRHSTGSRVATTLSRLTIRVPTHPSRRAGVSHPN